MTTTGPLFTGLALSAALLITACADPSNPAAGTPAIEAAPTSAAEFPVIEEVNAMEAKDLTSTPQDQGTSTVQMNPPHGEPGHRCEIAVGAPLDGAPPSETISIPPVGSTPSPAAMPINMPTNTNTGMLNPAHGEPGHDCAVPVGSPLPG